MKLIFRLSLLLFIATMLNVYYSPVTAQSIDNQFKILIESSNNYQEYKVIKKSEIQKLWKNTSDSLNAYHNKLNKANANFSQKDLEMDKLQKDLAEKENHLKNALNTADEMFLFGLLSVSKTSYNIIMWTFIGILAVLSVFLYYMSANAKKEAKQKIQLYQELTEEHKTFRAKSQENERKLARELQDERNKLAEYNIR